MGDARLQPASPGTDADALRAALATAPRHGANARHLLLQRARAVAAEESAAGVRPGRGEPRRGAAVAAAPAPTASDRSSRTLQGAERPDRSAPASQAPAHQPSHFTPSLRLQLSPTRHAPGVQRRPQRLHRARSPAHLALPS